MGQDEATKDQKASVMRRKTQSGKADHQARAMSLPKALRLTLARVANEMFGLAMAVIGARTEQCRIEALKEVLDGPALLMLLDGTGGTRAAALLDPLLVGGLIQQQTMGNVLPDPGGDPRAMTETDAAICAPLIDALFERAALLPETERDRSLLEGFRFGARAPSLRHLLMGLDAPLFEVVHLTVDIAGGQRQGQITLCLPPQDTKVSEDPETPVTDEAAPVVEPVRMADTVMALNVDLNIALARLSMPLSGVSALRPGQLLDLGPATFDRIRVLTTGGRRLATGVLGQIDGARAVRIDQSIPVADQPRRRASDRDAIPDQPEVSGSGVSLSSGQGTMPASPIVTDMLPDMSDLPGLADFDADSASTREAG